ncbi:MAG: ATP synthase F1 subunit delta [Anaerolineae bacterium]|nr:ATP synthase F1 subunit delta [Anaerolineae bacterium]
MSVQAQPKEYAVAIYELAFEHWTRQLGRVDTVLKKDPALRTAMQDLRVSARDRLQRLAQAVPGGLDSDVRKFLGTLLEAGQLGQLGAILAEFENLVRRRPERRAARVVSAVPLAEEEKEALRAKLERRFGPDLDFQFEVDRSLIGGIYLRVGDQVIDGSVAGKLSAMRDYLET